MRLSRIFPFSLLLSAFCCCVGFSGPSSPPITVPFDYAVLNAHKQISPMSCIPSSVEMVLKLNGKAPAGYYTQQNNWNNRTDGNFKLYDGKKINGLSFEHKFDIQRSDKFPFDDLYKTIDAELSAGRFVIVSLPSPVGWHIYVIYGKLENGEYTAFSRAFEFGDILLAANVKERIREMKGTDILVYRKD